MRIMRMVDAGLQEHVARLEGRDKGFPIHGNRFIAYHVFRYLHNACNEGDPLPSSAEIARLVCTVLGRTTRVANELHPGAYLAQLFKNQKKLAGLAERMSGDPELLVS